MYQWEISTEEDGVQVHRLIEVSLDEMIAAQGGGMAEARFEVGVGDLRRAAFTAEADPLFFQWQRGEIAEQVWLDKVQEIRDRYPDS